MRRLFNYATSKIGLAPGSVVFTGSQKVDEVDLDLIRFGPGFFEEEEFPELSTIEIPKTAEEGVVWLNVTGLHDTELIKAVGSHFGIHPLAVEDVVAVNSRPSSADYDTHVFAALKMMTLDQEEEVLLEHVSLVFGTGWVVSFQERPGDAFEFVRRRLREGTTRIRSRGADYLWYALLDGAVDSYLSTVGTLATWAEELEDLVWEETDEADDIPSIVQEVRREAMMVRKALRPLRQELESIHRAPPALIHEDTHPFLGDVRDHAIHLSDTTDNIREILSSVMDAHFSIVSTRTNDVMKVLTIMASVFIPLTFIAGVYGMNFQHMPELAVPWAYGAVWAVMLVVGGTMLAYFRRKKWL